jgi:hypothetical protein
MKNVKWKVSRGSTLLDCGSKPSESERLVLDELLNGELGKFPVVPDQSYTLEAGDLLASAYGDEFQRVREAHVMDEKEMDVSGGHLYAPPPVPGLPCAHPSMNRDHVGDDGMLYPACDSCDHVSPTPARRALFSERYKAGKVRKMTAEEIQEQADADHDRKREAKVVMDEMLRRVASGIAGEAISRVLGRALADGSIDLGGGDILAPGALKREPCAPHAHRVVQHRVEDTCVTNFHCLICQRAYAVNDQQMVLGNWPGGLEQNIRRILSA